MSDPKSDYRTRELNSDFHQAEYAWLLRGIDAFKKEFMLNSPWYKPDFKCKTCGFKENDACSAPHPCPSCDYVPYVRGVFVGCLCDVNRTRVVHVKDANWTIYGGRAMPNYKAQNTLEKTIQIRKGSPIANPFKMNSEDDRYRVIGRYRHWFYDQMDSDKEFREYVNGCANETLACWCSPKACHLHIIKEWFDNPQHLAEAREYQLRAQTNDIR